MFEADLFQDGEQAPGVESGPAIGGHGDAEFPQRPRGVLTFPDVVELPWEPFVMEPPD